MATQTNTSAEINQSATATSDKNSASVSYTNTAEATRATTNPPLVYLYHCSLPLLLFLLLFHMCEFCSFGPNNNTIDRDSTHIDFAGFFSVRT